MDGLRASRLVWSISREELIQQARIFGPWAIYTADQSEICIADQDSHGFFCFGITYLANTDLCELVTGLDTFFQGFPQDEAAQKTTCKGITRGIRVDDVFVLHRWNRDHPWAIGLVRVHQDRRLSTLRDDDDARARGVGFRESRDRLCDVGRLAVLRQPVGAGPRRGLALVSDEDVTVGEDLLQLHSEELGDEGS